MISNKDTLRFSGHETFHCKEQWMLKGVQLIQDQGDVGILKREEESVPLLGVGKNMVRSINHWLKAFGFLNIDNQISEFANLLFLVEELDPYLEKEGTLWLLQYFICSTGYASIFNLIFSEYFSNKATLEFSELQIQKFINAELRLRNQKPVTEKTLNSDYKVFIRTYVSPIKNEKTVEDDFNTPLLGLSLVLDTGRKNNLGQTVYRINRDIHSVPSEVFIYCLLNEFENQLSISFDDIRKTIGSYLCISNEGLERLIDEICEKHNEFVYKDDAGIRQLQLKNVSDNFKNKMLTRYYEI